MKVIQIVSHFDMGGAERIAINIAKSKSGIEYHMVEVAQGYSSFSSEFKKEMNDAGIVYHCSNIRNNKIALLFFPFYLRRIIKEIKPNVIQTHTEVPDLGLYLTHKLFPSLFENIKIVRTLHNTVLWSKWKFIGRQVERFVQSKHANVTNSKKIAKVYQEEFGADDNMKLIYNGFNSVDQLTYNGIVPNRKNVLFAGRFHAQKGLPVLIETIKRANPNIYHFHIAGKGELEMQLRDGLEGRPNVTISGPIFGLARYLSSFDFVFIPSVHEGLNSLSIEASLNHTPVIINNCDGLNETVPLGYRLKVNNNNVEEYAELFTFLETADSTIYSEETYAFALEKFSMSKMQSEYEKIYLK